MLYVSTRGAAPKKRFSEILLEGLAADGGLYVPEALPRVDLAKLRRKSYPGLAHEILSLFMDDVAGLKDLVGKTYSKEIFGSDDITRASATAAASPTRAPTPVRKSPCRRNMLSSCPGRAPRAERIESSRVRCATT